MSLLQLRNVKTNDIVDNKSKALLLKNTDDLVLEVDPKFHSAKWDTEPKQSIKELHRLRAEQIRQTYDYVVLYFSGGADSTTVLNAFVDNNIPIDEVIVYVNTDAENNPIVGGSYALKYLKEINYKGLVTVVDLNFDVLAKIIAGGTWQSYGSFSGLLHSFYRFRIDFYEKNRYISTLIRRKGKIAHIFGGVFPKIEKIDGELYSSISINAFMLSSTDPENVQFFTTADMPDIHIKHSYLLAKSYDEKLEPESRSYKLLIRDPYYEELDISKNGGRTKLDETQHGHHNMLYRLYESRDIFIHKYERVLYHFNRKDVANLDDFKALYKIGV